MSTRTALFQPLKVGSIEASNRLFMAPLTRCRAPDPLHIPNALMAEYYSQRASSGLLIAEATMVQENSSAFWTEPGIYNKDCVEGWKLTTDAVHAKGGKIILQIWHGGRACHTINGGIELISATDNAIEGHGFGAEFNKTGEKLPYEKPRALKDDEIPAVVELFRVAARNAIEAGFDGVEVHGANGYLIDQFWRGSQSREGPYGGSIENSSRFLLEVTKAVVDEIGADKVGIRLSPVNSYNGLKHESVEELLEYTVKKLDELNIAFIHIMRADFFGIQKADVIPIVRKNFKNVVVANMGYELDEAEKAIADGQVDAIAFGTKFLANPDLVERAKAGAELNQMDPSTFYTHEAKGYTDYPFLKQ